MSFFSRKMDYALLVLSHLGKNQQGSSAREISTRYAISRPFVANILKTLCHHGFLESHRGVHGGYVLKRKPESVSLAEVMNAIDEPFSLMECSTETDTLRCSIKPFCTIHTGMAEVHEKIKGILQSVTLGEILSPESKTGGRFLGLELVSSDQVE
ncbi:MAG: Rrf2 family transcriptional regulator [Gemmataceae bacterium]|nr:Rrf2 family transcriptional regulator [Gemmataceae bacterium]